MALADAYSCMAFGVDAVSFNPANLSYKLPYPVTVKLLGIGGFVANNAFTVDDYNYFNGRYLTDADKSKFLKAIPDKGLSVSSLTQLQTLGFSYKQFAFSATVIAGGQSSFARELFEVALFGNELNRAYTFTPASGKAIALAEYAVSHGISLPIKTPAIFHWGVGYTLKYFQGYSVYQIDDSLARTLTTIAEASAAGSFFSRQAKGGGGFGIDIGTVLNVKKSRFSLAVQNAYSTLKWDKKAEQTRLSFKLDETNIENVFVENAQIDSLFSTTDTTMATAPFQSTVAPTLRFGFLHPFSRVRVSAEYIRPFEKSALYQTGARLGLGLEYQPLRTVQLRAGLAAGKDFGFAHSYGVGFLLGVLRWDLAFQLHEGMLPMSSKGMSFATTFLLRI